MVVKLLKNKKLTIIYRPMYYQLIKSSTSVAANWRAATRARSDAEFYSKICIVVEECDETQFWIEYLILTGLFTENEADTIKDEVLQLLRIFTTIKKKMKEKAKTK